MQLFIDAPWLQVLTQNSLAGAGVTPSTEQWEMNNNDLYSKPSLIVPGVVIKNNVLLKTQEKWDSKLTNHSSMCLPLSQ